MSFLERAFLERAPREGVGSERICPGYLRQSTASHYAVGVLTFVFTPDLVDSIGNASAPFAYCGIVNSWVRNFFFSLLRNKRAIQNRFPHNTTSRNDIGEVLSPSGAETHLAVPDAFIRGLLHAMPSAYLPSHARSIYSAAVRGLFLRCLSRRIPLPIAPGADPVWFPFLYESMIQQSSYRNTFTESREGQTVPFPGAYGTRFTPSYAVEVLALIILLGLPNMKRAYTAYVQENVVHRRRYLGQPHFGFRERELCKCDCLEYSPGAARRPKKAAASGADGIELCLGLSSGQVSCSMGRACFSVAYQVTCQRHDGKTRFGLCYQSRERAVGYIELPNELQSHVTAWASG